MWWSLANTPPQERPASARLSLFFPCLLFVCLFDSVPNN